MIIFMISNLNPQKVVTLTHVGVSIDGATPKSSSIYSLGFSLQNHPATGYPHDYGKYINHILTIYQP